MGASGAMAGIGVMMDVFGNLNDAMAAEREGRATAKALEFNAEQKERNATQIELQTAEDERRLRIQNRRTIGAMRADYGASGVTASGSVLQILEESAAAAEFDAVNFRMSGMREADAVRMDARMDREKAKSVRRSTKFNAATAIFGAGKSAIGAYPTISRSFAPETREKMLKPKSYSGGGSAYKKEAGYY